MAPPTSNTRLVESSRVFIAHSSSRRDASLP
jgi:hypothetical protein